jgi:fructose-1,6-bisphosphatase/inositol monophosphatase family enzyme
VTGPDSSGVLALLDRTADAVAGALDAVADWGLTGRRPGEHHSDVAADRAAVETLLGGGVGVLSEESGRHREDRPITVVVDPLDGSTNAARGIPWYATSLCAVDGDGPLAAVVVHLPTGRRYHAVRGGGAWCDGAPVRPTGCTDLARAVVGLSGYPPSYLGWYQYRVLGALALDLCAVASGLLDAYIDCSPSAHGPWDYLGGLLVCREAGALATEAYGRELVELDHGGRRTPVAAATPELLAEAVAARATLPW